MKTNYIVLTALTFLLFCCANRKTEDTTTSPDVSSQAKASDLLSDLPQNDLFEESRIKLTRSADYRFEVTSVKKSTEAIEAALRKYPAYISSSRLHLENPILENKVVIRVQSQYFNDLLKDIDTQAVFVNFRNVLTDDVSKEFVDLESRLKTKREVQERYTEILRKNAGTIKELLEAERTIGELQEDIEVTTGKLNYLKNQVRLSTINLEFYQTVVEKIYTSQEISLGSKFINAMTTGMNVVVNVAIGLTYLWPLAILGGAGLYVIKRKRTQNIPLR
jgi:Domain of unknown function (DUF4349)